MRKFHTVAILIATCTFICTSEADAVTRRWNAFGFTQPFLFSNAQRWVPVGVPAQTDDVRFDSGPSGLAFATVDFFQFVSNSLAVTDDVQVRLLIDNEYQATSSVDVGGGSFGDDSKLTLLGGGLVTNVANLGIPGSSSATASLVIGESSAPSALAAQEVYVGGTASGSGLSTQVDVDFGSLVAAAA